MLFEIGLSLMIAAGAADDKSRPPRDAAKPPQACALLTAADIRRVHKVELSTTRPSTTPSGAALSMRQCYYETRPLQNSISVLVAVPDAKAPQAARDYWNDTLAKAAQEPPPSAAPADKAAAKKLRHRPEKVAGVGEEAYWVGDRAAGSLYVLRGDRFIRLSIGGKMTPEEKRERTKQLATLLLERL